VPTLPESQIVEHQVQHEDTSVLESVSVASATRALIAPTLAYEGVKIIYIYIYIYIVILLSAFDGLFLTYL